MSSASQGGDSAVMRVLVQNPLVAHVWRLMPGFNVYRNWYLGQGAFVQKHQEVRDYVCSYVETRASGPAIGSLFSATEALLKAAMKVEGAKPEVLKNTLYQLLEYCVAEDQRFFNLTSMCCDPRAIHFLNTFRRSAEHVDYSHDRAEMLRSGWKPEDPDDEYQRILPDRLKGAHLQLCGIFNQVDQETGRFLRVWKRRGHKDCAVKHLHNAKGVWDGEDPR